MHDFLVGNGPEHLGDSFGSQPRDPTQVVSRIVDEAAGEDAAVGGGEGHHEALQLGNKTVKRRPTLPLTRPIR